jgi:hypothetical protein
VDCCYYLALLLECLEQDKDMSLRAAAGEFVAWIHTAHVELSINNDDECGNNNSNTTQQKYAAGSWEGSDCEDIMAEIESCMEVLSNQSGHYNMSKKVKRNSLQNGNAIVIGGMDIGASLVQRFNGINGQQLMQGVSIVFSHRIMERVVASSSSSATRRVLGRLPKPAPLVVGLAYRFEIKVLTTVNLSSSKRL